MVAYKFNPETKEYFSTVNCQLNPVASKREGREIYLLPADSTFIEPLKAKENYKVIFNGTEWEYEAIPQPEPEPTPEPPTLEETKSAKKQEIANARYEAETAGITYGTATIRTDRDSQALITGAALAAYMDNTYTLKWKTADGFIDLTAVQVVAIAQAVRAHVQECFNREAELLPLIDAAETKEAVDAIKWEKEA